MHSKARLGFGTAFKAETSECAMREAIVCYLKAGGFCVDTAPNYAQGIAQILVGQVLQTMPTRPHLSSKVGYPSLRLRLPQESDDDFIQRSLVGPGIIRPEAATPDGHVLSGPFLEWQLAASLQELGVATLDHLALHNVETRLKFRSRKEFEGEIYSCFEACEMARERQQIQSYGFASFYGFRVPEDDPHHLSLARLAAMAKDVGGARHGFRTIQSPMNLGMWEAWAFSNQVVHGRPCTLLEAALDLDIEVAAACPFFYGEVERNLQLLQALPGLSRIYFTSVQSNHIRGNLDTAARYELIP